MRLLGLDLDQPGAAVDRDPVSRWYLRIQDSRGRGGNDPSVDIAKDATPRFESGH